MRFILGFPALALVVAGYNAFVLLTFGILDSLSQMFSWVLPSGSEAFFSAGDLFVIAGVVALFTEIVKAAKVGTASWAARGMSLALFAVALAEFLFVPFCGTSSFFILLVMTLISVLAGFAIARFGRRVA